MANSNGICPGCDGEGAVGEPCGERACGRIGYRCLPVEHALRLRTMPRGECDPLLGRAIGDYLLVDVLGGGGFGKVYLALQMPILMKTALKLMDRANADPASAVALGRKFEGEARALAQLSHPNVVKLLRYGLHGDLPYLVMEFVQGRTLGALVKDLARRGDDMDVAAIPHVLHQVLNALDAAHRLDIVHRDIKPDNVMLQEIPDDRYHVRVVDFGLAKFVGERRETSAVVGTPLYMAPEQFGRRGIGPWTDLYAVGVMAFELMTGRRPFAGRSYQEIVGKKIDPCYDPASSVKDLDLPPFVLDFLRRAVARRPADRFQAAADFGQTMDAVLARSRSAGGATISSGDLSGLLDSDDLAWVAAEKDRLRIQGRILEEDRQRFEREKHALEERKRRAVPVPPVEQLASTSPLEHQPATDGHTVAMGSTPWAADVSAAPETPGGHGSEPGNEAGEILPSAKPASIGRSRARRRLRLAFAIAPAIAVATLVVANALIGVPGPDRSPGADADTGDVPPTDGGAPDAASPVVGRSADAASPDAEVVSQGPDGFVDARAASSTDLAVVSPQPTGRPSRQPNPPKCLCSSPDQCRNMAGFFKRNGAFMDENACLSRLRNMRPAGDPSRVWIDDRMRVIGSARGKAK